MNRPASHRSLLFFWLNLFAGLFLIETVLSLADDSLMYFAGSQALSLLRTLVWGITLLVALSVYLLMALTPAIPKKWFLPLTLFWPVATLLQIPFVIYHFDKILLIGWLTSCLQTVLLFWVFHRLRGGAPFRWPPVPATALAASGFRWQNLTGFILLNLFGLLPLAGIYLYGCAVLAVGHFSDGFIGLHPGGLTVQTRSYVREDGKTIRLFPMAHVAEADFYQKIARTFKTNSVVLMEGVTDENHLLTNQISYQRMAKSLGLAEQHETFKPRQGKIVRADIDVNQFSARTIALLNWIMFLHGHGVNAATAPELLDRMPELDEHELFADLLTKRNQHLLGEIQNHLSQTDDLVIPWGAAHMPGISQAIQKLGFHLQQSNDYTVIRFFHPSAQPPAKPQTIPQPQS